MENPASPPVAVDTTPTPPSEHTLFRPDPAAVRRAIERRSVASLATTSPAGHAHAAAVLYQAAGDALYISTMRASRKARNIAWSPTVGVSIYVRRLPFGAPATIQFQASATLLANDDPEVARLAATGHLDRITGHGELELPGGCIVRIALPKRMVTYGLGMSLRRLITHPLDAAGEVRFDDQRP